MAGLAFNTCTSAATGRYRSKTLSVLERPRAARPPETRVRPRPAPVGGRLPTPVGGRLPTPVGGRLPAPVVGRLPAPVVGWLPAPVVGWSVPAPGLAGTPR